MKKIIAILLFITFNSCSKPGQCVESTGALTSKTITGNFTQITVHKGIELIITQGNTYNVEIKTGANLIGDISATISADGMLTLTDNTTCNWVREYGQTKVYVTAPNLTDIICKTEKNISSTGVLTYPLLRLNSMDLTDGAGTGDFYLQINNNNLVVDSNNISNFYLSGQTDTFNANFYEGNGRIEAANLTANNLIVFHRGSNDMIVKPMQSIKGNMYSTGNIICKNHPPVVDVTPHYQGQLIFN